MVLLSIELENEALLNKCVRCKKSDVNLFTTVWDTKANIKGKKEKLRIKFSACDPCLRKIEKFTQYEKFYYKNKGICGICTWMISWLVLIFSILFSFMGPNPTLAITGVVGAILLFLPFIIMKIYKNSHPENLRKYISINSSGIITIKGKKSGEADQKISIVEVQQAKIKKIQDESYKFCPNCGSTIKTLTGFCKTCGKNLKPKQ